MRCPRSTFSFKPTRVSTAPLRAASVSTLVVSWKLAPERKLSDCNDAFVIPSRSVRARAGFGLRVLAIALPASSASALACLTSSFATRLPLTNVVPPASSIFNIEVSESLIPRKTYRSTTSFGSRVVSPISTTRTLLSI